MSQQLRIVIPTKGFSIKDCHPDQGLQPAWRDLLFAPYSLPPHANSRSFDAAPMVDQAGTKVLVLLNST